MKVHAADLDFRRGVDFLLEIDFGGEGVDDVTVSSADGWDPMKLATLRGTNE